MAHLFFKQDNGKFCIFSTVSDTMMFWDYDDWEELKKDYTEMILKDEKERISQMFEEQKNRIEEGKPLRFGTTFEECRIMHNERVSKELRIKKVKN